MRTKIDAAVTKALNLDPDWVNNIRRELAKEPRVTDRRVGV